MSYEGQLIDDNRPQVGLLLSYYSEYLFPEVYDGIESSLSEKGYRIGVAITKNRLNDEAAYLEGMLKNNVSGLIIEGSRSAFPNPNIRLYEEIKKRNIPTIFIHNHYENMAFDSVETSDTRAAYELTRILIEHGHRKIGGILKYDDMQGIARYKGLYSVCPIMASNTMTTVSAGIPQEKWKISSVKKDLHIFTVIPGIVQHF